MVRKQWYRDVFNTWWKSVVAERFIRTLKNKIYKHMTFVLKNILIN